MVTKYVGVKFTTKEVEAIDRLVESSHAQSRSDVIRYAVRRYFELIDSREAQKA